MINMIYKYRYCSYDIYIYQYRYNMISRYRYRYYDVLCNYDVGINIDVIDYPSRWCPPCRTGPTSRPGSASGWGPRAPRPRTRCSAPPGRGPTR